MKKMKHEDGGQVTDKMKSAFGIRHSAFILSVVIFLMLFTTVEVRAQLRVGLKLEHTSVLQFEQAKVFVLLFNDSNIPFAIDESSKDNKAHLNFIVAKGPNDIIYKSNNKPIITKLKLKPGEKREIMVNLSRWYNIRSEGGYFVSAVIDWGGSTFMSDKRMFDVVSGIEINKVRKGVPWDIKSVRTYSLRYWPRERKEYLFLRVDGEEAKGRVNYGVFQLGRVIRVFKPVLEIDRLGNIKIKHQSDQDCFAWSIFKSLEKRVLFVDQTYHLPDGKPYPARSSSLKLKSVAESK
ncbi:hypothetical protein ACFLS1_11640 [Verrucomicrobiota bacterium]